MPKGKFFTNQEIADLLKKVASAYSVKGEDLFRISAYEEAAASIEHSTSELKDLWDDGKLEDVPGVGKSIAEHLDEFFRTGKVKHFEEIFASLPEAMFIFEKIPGVGPKKALSLAEGLHISDPDRAIKRLQKAIKEGKVRKLEGFGEKSEVVLLKGIDSLKKGEMKSKRMPLYLADAVAEEIITYLKQNPLVLEALPLGSLRRMLATIGDIDMAVSTKKPKEVMTYFLKYPQIKRVVSQGEELLSRVVLKSGIQVDIRFSSPETFGAMLQYFTGSKQHNIALRGYALSKGLSLSEYGIKNLKSQKILKTENEAKFYQALGMKLIPPEIREGAGEIQAALLHGLPSLVELRDIKGDLHLHSDFPIESSHDLGDSPLKVMVQKGEELSYQYLGFTEHNPSTSRHSEKEILELLKKKQEFFEQFRYSYEKGTSKLPIKILNSLEIDIKPAGDLAIPEKGFDYLDYAIVSVHSSFDLDRSSMTKRILTALSHPKAKILGHPTGRMIDKREGYELDWEQILDFCLKNHKFLEISAWPNRLDLPDVLVREAVKSGVKLVVNSDSHSVEEMGLMVYGVSVARRGWAEAKDIINTLPVERLSDILISS